MLVGSLVNGAEFPIPSSTIWGPSADCLLATAASWPKNDPDNNSKMDLL
jgi:hypothetical protein